MSLPLFFHPELSLDLLHESPLQAYKFIWLKLPSSRHAVLTTLSSIRDPKTPRYVEILI